MLAAYGVPLAAEEFVATPVEAVAAAERIGFPVVAKLNGDKIAHKTERGLVRLRLGDGPAVERAAAELLGAAGLRVLVPERLPPNDGGIAYGQLAVAAARLGEEAP